MRWALIVLFAVWTNSVGYANDLTQRLAKSGALSNEFEILYPAMKTLLADRGPPGQEILFNQDCPAQSVCVFFIDIHKLPAALRLRYDGYFKLLPFNLEAIAPNVVLIDANLVRVQISNLYKNLILINQFQSQRHTQPQNRPSDLKAVYSVLSRYETFDNAYLAWDSGVFPDFFREFIEALEGEDNKLEGIALSFAWQMLHELRHLQQFQKSPRRIEIPLHWSLSKAISSFLGNRDQRRGMEADADSWANFSVKEIANRYVEKARAKPAASSKLFIEPGVLVSAAIVSSADAWQTFDYQRLIGKTRPLKPQTAFLFLTFAPCPKYKEAIQKSGISTPSTAAWGELPRIRYDIDEIFDVMERPGFLISGAGFDLARRRLVSLESDGFYNFGSQRFGEILALQSSNVDTFQIPITSTAEAAFINSLHKNDPALFPATIGNQATELSLSTLEAAWKDLPLIAPNSHVQKEEAANCASNKCAIYHFGIGNYANLAYLDVISDPATGKVISAFGQAGLGDSLRAGGLSSAQDGDLYRLVAAVFRPFIPEDYITIDELSPRFKDWVDATSGKGKDIALAMLDEMRAKWLTCSYGSSSVLGANRVKFAISTTTSQGTINFRYGF
ncbi:MAG: hypothetical protein U1E61_08885 [Bradyrhizobium sp.]